ncbi:glycosyltransferase [Geomonas propionica]|uniref:Glycosyltransferase n=1 Tax=Geomonas propionica TaxID=2798582 RepID=A0ABS0YUB2_9BACT|nr:glycosyltransferase [Geomonas propionica]MBJ6801037.1 glycosyltransferase [Geomonas propionica]
MPKLKILFISHSSYLFGAENCALSLIEGLDRERFDTAVVLPANGPFQERLAGLGVKTHILPLEWWVKNEGRLLHAQHEIPLALDRLLRIIDEEKPDVIHSNTSVICWGAVAAALKGIPHVWHLHEILNGHPSLQSILPLPLLYESVNFLTDQAVTVSQAVSDELAGFVAPAKVRLIYNGVPYHTPTAPGKLRAELGASPEQHIAVCVTSLQKYKGLDNLMAAAAKACARDEGLLFAIAGAGPPEAVAALQRQVKELDLEGKVFHLGFRNDVADLLAGSDLFVLPSTKEAFPLVVLEAMSHGRPVVATDCGGTREMVLEGETGFVVPVEDPEALAEKIVELCNDPARGIAMGEAGRRRYCDSFTLERYVEAFSSLYRELSVATKTPLTSRQASLLDSFVAAYVEHLKTMRVIPNLEQELNLQKRQLAEVSAQLSRQQEALLNCEQQKTLLAQEHAQQLLSLAKEVEDRYAQLESRLEMKKLQKADLNDELALARELRAELESYLDYRSTELESRDQRIRQMELELAERSALQSGLEAGLRQRDAEIAALTARAQEQESALEAAEATRVSLAASLDEATSDLASAQRYAVELKEELQSKHVEIAALNQRLQQVEEEMFREQERVAQFVALHEENMAAAETLRGDLERRLQQQAVRIQDHEQRNRQALEELERQSAQSQAHLGEKEETIRHLGEMLESTAHKLKAAEQGLAQAKKEQEEEKACCDSLLREKDQRIDDLLNSLSWKITAPLRKAYDLARGK